MPVADPPLYRPESPLPLRADRDGLRSGRDRGRHGPGAEPFSHDGELCSFDAFLRVYEIRDAALDTLAIIIRGADTARPDLAPQAAGLLALSLGLSANFADDHTMLEHGLTMYDALYTWCRSCQGETHNWTPPVQTA